MILDFFDRADATSRFGEDNPFEPYREEAVATARAMLRRPPRPGDDIAFEGAAHSSVLPIQVEGALGLTCDHVIDQHRDLVRGLVESWPGGDDEPDRAWLVQDALED